MSQTSLVSFRSIVTARKREIVLNYWILAFSKWNISVLYFKILFWFRILPTFSLKRWKEVRKRNELFHFEFDKYFGLTQNDFFFFWFNFSVTKQKPCCLHNSNFRCPIFLSSPLPCKLWTICNSQKFLT